MSTFGTDNHSIPLLSMVGRTRSPVSVDGLQTSFVAVLEESKRKTDDSQTSKDSEQKQTLEGITLRKNLDRKEIEAAIDRRKQLCDEYLHRADRREVFNEKPTETVAKFPDTLPPSINSAVSDGALWSTFSATPPNIVWARQNTTAAPPVAVEPSTPTVSPITEISVAFPVQQTTTAAPSLLSAAPALPIASPPVPKSAIDPSTFTVFTVAGRFGAEKKEKEDDKKAERRSVSLLGSLLSSSEGAETTFSESVQDKRRSPPPNEPPGRKQIESATVELPKREKEGIPLKELFDSKELIPTNEPYKGELPDRIQPVLGSRPDVQDRVNFVRRVAAACQSAANRNGTVRIKLHPESLGPLTVRVSTKRGKFSVHFETETEDAKRLLLDSLDDLRTQLREMHIELEYCQVE